MYKYIKISKNFMKSRSKSSKKAEEKFEAKTVTRVKL